MSKNSEKRQKCRKTINNLKKLGKNLQKYRKPLIISKNVEKNVKNIEKSGIKRQKYRKALKKP